MRALLCLMLLAGCGAGAPAADASPCDPVETFQELVLGMHVADDTDITWSTNPPSSGPHFTRWARWARVYEDPMPRGHWVHNLEHGGVIFLYNCPTGCPELVDTLTGFAATLPIDPSCPNDVPGRWLITADPLLPAGIQVAAAAWGYTYTATCFDAHTLRRFYETHAGEGPEDTCFEGQVPEPGSTPDGGSPQDAGAAADGG